MEYEKRLNEIDRKIWKMDQKQIFDISVIPYYDTPIDLTKIKVLIEYKQ